MSEIEQRKIVPIAAKISAGKSSLLNVIYNIDFLECKAGIGTKFVNILRYNPNIEEPCFYHLKLEKKKEGGYIFKRDKDYEIKFGKKAIIEENKNVNQILAASPGYNYEDLFYITELNETGFIKDKEYLLTHDLCDIPGLSEYQADQIIDNNAIKDDETFEKKVLKGIAEFGIVYNNIKKDNKNNEKLSKKTEENIQDELYYQVDIEKDKTYLTEIFKIIKNYIDGIILVLSQDKFYHEENFEIVAKLSKVTQKEISNSLIILNKIDLSPDPIADINKCKGLFSCKFPEFRTFNINNNTFVAISSFQLQNELLMNKSFIHLIKFHFYNYLSIIKDKTITSRSFIEHLSDIIFQGEDGITKQKIKQEVNKLNKSKDIFIINEKIRNVIKELRDKFTADSIIFGIKEDDINNEEDDDDDEEDENDDDLNPSYIIKMLYIFHKEKKLIPPLSNETKELINYFTIKKTNNNIKNNTNENKNKEDENYQINKLNKNLINQLESFGDKIKNNKINDNNFKKLINEIARFIHFLKIYNVIFIPFLGESNVGKSTIINGIVGKEILPTYSNECTKRGILIKYIDSDETFIYKANLLEEIDLLGHVNYFFKVVGNNDLIGKGENKVKDTLNSLNYDFNENERDSFYYIKTRIKLFEDIGLNNSLKEMIYLIDFPGFGTGNVFEKRNTYDKVMSICNSFIFVVKNAVIRENSAQSKLQAIFDQAQIQKKKLSSQFIKSCLFILNNEKEQTTTDNDLNQAKKDINKILNNSEDLFNDINACFFNAKYYENYCKIYNYFYKLDDTITKEYEEYKNRKSSFFKNPLLVKKNEEQEFFDFFYSNIRTKIKELYDINNSYLRKILKTQKINENVEKKLKQIINDMNVNENFNYEKLPEIEDKLSKIISLGQSKTSELKTLKESNINKFKEVLEFQVNYINKIKQDELDEELENVIHLLDDFFERDFDERKKDLNEIKNLKNEGIEIKTELTNFLENNKIFIEKVKTEFKSKIKSSLIENKKKLKAELESKNYNNILEEINNQIKANLKGLNENIIKFIKSNEEKSNKLLIIRKEIINQFSLKDYKGKKSFNTDFLKKIGNEKQDLEEQLSGELKSSCNSFNILWKKGIKEFFNSIFSDLSYLENIVDILIDTSLKKINFILDLIEEESRNIINSYYKGILFLIRMACLEFTDEQKKIWKELCSLYKETRSNLINTKSYIIEILNQNKK